MTGGNIREYAQAVRKRILDEFTDVTGYHRKSAIRLLGRVDEGMPKARDNFIGAF